MMKAFAFIISYYFSQHNIVMYVQTLFLGLLVLPALPYAKAMGTSAGR